jgi:opacity protein-like surface antigen
MRERTRFIAVLAASLLVAAAGSRVAKAESPEDAAQSAAESWLKVVDGGNYAGSWDHASASLKAAVKQGDWAQSLGAARGPVGALSHRRMKSRQLSEKLPPTTRTIGGRVYTWSGNGPHVVVVFDSAFASKASTETVIVAKDADGSWRVSGYSMP